jgi:hypothetical protein
MARFRSRNLIVCFAGLLLVLLIAGSVPARAVLYGGEWIEDDHLHVLLKFDGRSVTTADTDVNAITIPRDHPMEIYLELNLTDDVPILMNGSIVFYYNSIPVLPITIKSPYSNTTNVLLEPGFVVQPVTYMFNLSDYLSYNGIKLMTGVYEARLNFQYSEIAAGDSARSAILHTISHTFFFKLPAQDIIEVLTSVAGIATSVTTVGAVAATGGSMKGILDAIQTAHKVRSIQKKAGEIKSLPNLTVLGALPLLFSILATYVKVKKKKPDAGEPEDSSGVSEYIVRQRLRESAPEAWPGDKCPQCKRKWDKKTNTCKKCKINEEQAREAYTELLVSRTEKAIRVMGKKKALSIRKLAKNIKSNEYNAGVVGAAMVDTDVTEIQKVETPFRSFVINIGGLIFLVLTWQQLLGGASSQFQTTLTMVGAGMSLAVICALYFARKTQIEKLRVEVEAGGKMMPTSAELQASEAPKPPAAEGEEPERQESASQEEATFDDISHEDDEDWSDEETVKSGHESTDADTPDRENDDSEDENADVDTSDWQNDDSEDSLPPERLEKERK